MRKKEDMKMGYAHGKDKVHSMGYMGGSQMVMPMGYAYGTKMTSPMGYYSGSLYAEATPQQEQQMMAMQPGVRLQAPMAQPEGPNAMQTAVQGAAMNEALDPVTDYVKDQGAQALTGQTSSAIADAAAKEASKSAVDAGVAISKDMAADAGAEAVKAAGGGALNSALSGFGGAAATDLLTKGEVDEKTLLKGGLAMGANMLLPGSGFLVGPALSALGLKDGTMEVPPMGYAGGAPGVVGMLADDEGRDKLKELAGGTIVGKALGFADGSRYAMEAAERSKMSPEEFQKKFLEERIVAPAKAFLEERPMMQAPLFMIAAAKDFEEGKLPLGKFGGGRLEGGKDRIAYRHKKYGDFEFNPESERVSYKKTFRF